MEHELGRGRGAGDSSFGGRQGSFGGRQVYYETAVPTPAAIYYETAVTTPAAIKPPKRFWSKFAASKAGTNVKSPPVESFYAPPPEAIQQAPPYPGFQETIQEAPPRRSFQQTMHRKQLMFHMKEGLEAFETGKYVVAEQCFQLALTHLDTLNDPTLNEQANVIRNLVIDTHIRLQNWRYVIAMLPIFFPQTRYRLNGDHKLLALRLKLASAYLRLGCQPETRKPGRPLFSPDPIANGRRDCLFAARDEAWGIMELTSEKAEAGEAEALQVHQDAIFLMSKILGTPGETYAANEARFYKSLLPEGFTPHCFFWDGE